MTDQEREYGKGEKSSIGVWITGVAVVVVSLFILITATLFWTINPEQTQTSGSELDSLLASSAKAASVKGQTQLRGAPAIRESLRLAQGINQSLTALRSWVISGEEKYKEERELAWANEIRPALRNLMVVQWDETCDIESLDATEQQLLVLEQTQKELEAIAWKAENLPATQLLSKVARPISDTIISALNLMIEEGKEKEELSAAKKDLQRDLNTIRSRYLESFHVLGRFLHSGASQGIVAFEKLWKEHESISLKVVSHSSLFSPRQRAAYRQYVSVSNEFYEVAQQIITRRLGKDWNLAMFWFQTKITPSVDEVHKHLQIMVQGEHAPSGEASQFVAEEKSQGALRKEEAPSKARYHAR
jgi:hypothetical protein